MPSEIVLLSGEAEAEHPPAVLAGHNPALTIVCPESKADLEAACLDAGPPPGGGRRLIAFCTGIIVPAAVLDALDGPAYNFHPGPPTYPGAHAASFAVYDGAERFGVTAHVMEKSVDSGAIVGVRWFDVPVGARYLDLEIAAYRELFHLFLELAPHLANDDRPLTPVDEAWGTRKTTNKEFESMKTITPEMDEDEIKRRWRAFG